MCIFISIFLNFRIIHFLKENISKLLFLFKITCYSRLTVEEHLWFYARLKGMKTEELKAEMET